jgi:hypothetical protein
MAIIKNVLKHSLDNSSNIKGYISQADRLKIKRHKDGSIHLNTKDKDFLKKKNAIRSDIADKRSTKGYGKIFVDGEETYGKFNTGKDNLKTLGDIKFQKRKTGVKSAKKRAKSTKATSITDANALQNYMRYKQITDPSELSQFDYQEIARYVNIRSKQLRDYKANVKAQRRLDGNATDGHLVSPHDPTAVNSITQRFVQPGKNYIDDDGNMVLGNFAQGEASGQLDRLEKIALGIPNDLYEDLVMFFDPSRRGIRSFLTDDTLNEIVTRRDWKGALKKQKLKAEDVFTGDYESVGRGLDAFD